MTTDGKDLDAPDGRARLLLAARAELEEKGIAGLSLRGIARRADVSHAAPTYHFGDRAGLLTAVATSGFLELGEALRDAEGAATGAPVASLGRAYVDFGLQHEALFDLMFRPAELHPDDADLRAAQTAALGRLNRAVESGEASALGSPSSMTLASWAFAHGLVELLRHGALQGITGDPDPAHLRDRLVAPFDAASAATGTAP